MACIGKDDMSESGVSTMTSRLVMLGVSIQVGDASDDPDRDLGFGEERDQFVAGQRTHEVGHRSVALFEVVDPVRVGGKARINDHVGAADDPKDPFRHRLGGRRESDEAAIGGFVNIARRAAVQNRLPMRRGSRPVSRWLAICGPKHANIGSNSDRSMTCSGTVAGRAREVP